MMTFHEFMQRESQTLPDPATAAAKQQTAIAKRATTAAKKATLRDKIRRDNDTLRDLSSQQHNTAISQ